MKPIYNTPYAIETIDLYRHFGKVKAVDGINLSVNKGGVYGVLGPNGAGKTTLIRMLATLLHPSSGTAKIFGRDIISEKAAIRCLISLTGQFASVDDDLTGYENLILLARLLGYNSKKAKVRAQELLEGFDLLEAGRRQVKTYSGGMRKRIDIAASIVLRPSLIFLDEPTTGLDPRSRGQVWEIIRSLVAGGTTVLLTTQYLDEADHLAERIAVIDHGKVIAEGTPAELKASVGSSILRVRVTDSQSRQKALKLISDIMKVDAHLNPDHAEISVQTKDALQASEIITELSSAGIAVTSFSLGQPSLDEVFLSLTGKPAGDENPSRSAVETGQ